MVVVVREEAAGSLLREKRREEKRRDETRRDETRRDEKRREEKRGDEKGREEKRREERPERSVRAAALCRVPRDRSTRHLVRVMTRNVRKSTLYLGAQRDARGAIVGVQRDGARRRDPDRALSCHMCHIMSCHVMLYHAMSCHVM